MTDRMHSWLFPAVVVLALGCALTLREAWLAVPGVVRVHFLNVGQGDGTLVVTPSGRQIVIDGGRDLRLLEGLGQKMAFSDRTIDLVILTHPQLDHIFALPEVLRRYRVGAVLMTGAAYDLPRYDEFLSLIKEQNIPVLLADPARDLDLGDGVRLDVLWPRPGLLGKKPAGDINNTSIALLLRYGDDSVLFTGDMEEIEEDAILGAGIDVDADILKVAHHGSRSSTSTGFLLAVSPDLAVISAGRDNSYGHPHPQVMSRLRHFGVPVRVTAEEGTVTVLLDGKEGTD